MRVFLSYSRRDTAIADRLVADLEAHDVDVDIDRRDLPYGEAWQVELQRFIQQADTIVWLASEASVTSQWCKWELGEAQRLSKRLLPVRVSPLAPDQLPEALGRIHILPAEGVYDPAQHIEILIGAIQTDRAWMETHTRLADRAAEWIARGRSADRLLRGRALRDAEDWRDGKPERAPAPSGDTLDLLLQSRRGATRGLRRLLGVAVAIALGMVGLSAFALVQWVSARTQEAEAIRQADIANTARDQAQSESARSAVSAATDMPARGQADQALLMLLDAAQTFGDTPSPEWHVAMHKALDAVDGRTIVPIPLGSLPFETRDGLYFEDPSTHDLWHVDGKAAAPVLALQGSAGDSPFAAMDTGPAGLIAIRANLEIVVIADGMARPAGAFSGQLSQYPEGKEGNDIWTIDPDGWVLRDLAFSEPDQLVDTSSGLRLDLPGQPFYPIYYHAPDGRRFLVEAGFDSDDNPAPIIEIADGRLVSLPSDKTLIDKAKFYDCTLGGRSRPLAYQQHVVDNLGEAGLFRVRCAVAEELDYTSNVLITRYTSGSAGIGRSDMLVEFGEESDPYDRSLDQDLEYSNSFRLGDGEFTWTGVSQGETGAIGAVFNRGVFVQDNFLTSALMRFEPERPTMGAMLGNDRIAVVEPRGGRLVIYDYTRGPWRPSLYAPLADQNRDGHVALLDAAVSCVGYDGRRDVALPDGTDLSFVQAAEDMALELRFGSGAEGRSIKLLPGQYCGRAGFDWNRILVSGAGETRLVDIARLAGGASMEDATLAFLPQALEMAVVAPATGAIFARLDEVNVQRWRIDASGHWLADIVYEGDLELGPFEPNADGSALLMTEYQPSSYIRGFLYSVDARSTWVDLIRDYKPSNIPAFAVNGDIVIGGTTLRMPAPGALIAAAEAGLAASCAPTTAGDYRTSPCWPDWL